MITAVIIVILISMVIAVIRAISGPTVYDRILAANAFGTKTMVLITLLSIVTQSPMLLDIAIIYALINFITTIGFLKYFKYQSLGKE